MFFPKMMMAVCGMGFSAGLSAADGELAKDCDLILNRLRGKPQALQVSMENFLPDGTWSDIDYQSQNRGIWPAGSHLSRTLQLAAYDRRAALQALDAWVRMNPRCFNWWWNCIWVPRHLADILIRLRMENVPPELQKSVRSLLYQRPRYAMKGQNLVWVSGILIKEGLLYHEQKLIRRGMSGISGELEIRPAGKEGLQKDFSYHQHGTQLQFGNYGLAFAAEQICWANMLRGTRFAYPEEKIDLLYHYFMDGLRWTLRDGIMDYSSCGRQLKPRDPEIKFRAVIDCGKQLLPLLSPERRKLLQIWLDAPEKLCGARAFPHSGYLVCHTPEWYFSVKMNSRKLIGSEGINQENLRSLYQADGAVFFGTGARYEGYPALFDARMIPGTTEIQDRRLLTPDRDRNPRGYYAVWAGYPAAVAAYRLDTGDLAADKVYFVTSSGVTGSGSDIRSGSDFPVVTCVDQFRADSEKNFPVLCRTPEGMPEIRRMTEEVHGNWKEFFHEHASVPVSGKVVKLFIPHGVKPAGAAYFYCLRKAGVPEKTEIRLKTSSPRIHALLAEGKVLTAAFAAGSVTLPDGKTSIVKPGITVLDAAGKRVHFEPFRER